MLFLLLLGGGGAVGYGFNRQAFRGVHIQLSSRADYGIGGLIVAVADYGVVGVQHHADRQRAGDLGGAVACLGGGGRRGGRGGFRGNLLPFAGERQAVGGNAFWHVKEVLPILVRGDRHIGNGILRAVTHIERALFHPVFLGGIDQNLHILAGLGIVDAVMGQQRAFYIHVGIFESQRHLVIRRAVRHSHIIRPVLRAARGVVKHAEHIIVQRFRRLVVAAEQAAGTLLFLRLIAFLKLDAYDHVLRRHIEGILVDTRMNLLIIQVQIIAILCIGCRAGKKLQQINPGNFIAFLRGRGDRDRRSAVGLGAGEGHLALFLVNRGRSRDRKLRRAQAAGQLFVQVFLLVLGEHLVFQQIGEHFAQQLLGDILGAFHRIVVFLAVLVFLGLGRRGFGRGVHRRVGGGFDCGIPSGNNMRAVFHRSGHVLHHHVNGEVPAGRALVARAFVRGGIRLDISVSLQGDTAFRLHQPAVHGGVHIADNRRDSQGNGQAGGSHVGGDLRGSFCGGLDIAAGMQHRAIVNIHIGIEHNNADRQRGQVVIVAAGINFRFHFGGNSDMVLLIRQEVFVLQGAVFFVQDSFYYIIIAVQHFGQIDAGKNLAAHIHLRAAHLHVDQVQDIPDFREIHNIAGMVNHG